MLPRLACLLCLLSLVRAQVLDGAVQLDKFSFDKIVPKFPFSLVKFDAGYPSGDKHKNFGALVKEVM